MRKHGSLKRVLIAVFYLAFLQTNDNDRLMAAAYQGDVLPDSTTYGIYTIVPTQQAVLWGMGSRPHSAFYLDTGREALTASISEVHENTIPAAPAKTLYGVSQSNFLYMLSPAGGDPAAIVALPGSKNRSSIPNGTLYVRWNESFYEVNPVKGTSIPAADAGQQLKAIIPVDGGFCGLYGFSGEPQYSISLLTGIPPLPELPDPERERWQPFLEWWLRQLFPPHRPSDSLLD